MQVILTPTSVANMFGPGLNGFASSVPGPATQMSAEWFNSAQQEIVNVITGQGLVLDGLQFDQMKRAIDNYAFVDPTITSTLTIPNGASLNVQLGGTLQCDAGSTASFDTLSTSGLATLKSCAVTNLLTASGGLSVPGGTLSCGTAATFSGATTTFSGTNVATGLTTTLTTNGNVLCNGELNSATRMRIRGSITVAAGDLSVDASDNLRFRDASATKFVHVNPSGWVLGLGRADTLGGAALTLSLDTATAVAPLAAADLVVEASVWVSRAIAGIVTISLTEVGVGQIGTNDTFVVPATGGSNFYQISFSRTRVAAPTSPARIYRLTVDGGASNVTCRNGLIRVSPTG